MNSLTVSLIASWLMLLAAGPAWTAAPPAEAASPYHVLPPFPPRGGEPPYWYAPQRYGEPPYRYAPPGIGWNAEPRGPVEPWSAPYPGFEPSPAMQTPPPRRSFGPPSPQDSTARLAAELDALRAEMDAGQAELDRVRMELQQAQARLAETRQLLEQSQTREQQQAARQRLLGEQLLALTAERDAARGLESKLTAELEAMRQQLAARDRKLAELQDLLRSTGNQRAELSEEVVARDKRIAALTAEIQAATQALAQARSETVASGQRLGATEAQHQACQTQLAGLTAELQHKSSAEAGARQSLAEADSVRNRLQAELAACNAGLERKNSAEGSARQALSEAKSECNRLRTELAACGEELARARAAIAARSAMAPPPPVIADSDGDQVPDPVDLCPKTRPGTTVGPTGCALSAPMALPGVNFRYDSSVLTKESHAILDRAAGILRQHPGMRLEVAGHTDTQGDPKYNLWLSERRASVVKDYLVKAGVNADNLTVHGYGSEQPIGDNNTWEGLALNRRVELRRLP